MERALHSMKRALHAIKRALHSRKRALHYKRAHSSMKRALLSMEEKRERDRAIHEHEDSGDDALPESEQDWIKLYFGWQLGLKCVLYLCVMVCACVKFAIHEGEDSGNALLKSSRIRGVFYFGLVGFAFHQKSPTSYSKSLTFYHNGSVQHSQHGTNPHVHSFSRARTHTHTHTNTHTHTHTHTHGFETP